MDGREKECIHGFGGKHDGKYVKMGFNNNRNGYILDSSGLG